MTQDDLKHLFMMGYNGTFEQKPHSVSSAEALLISLGNEFAKKMVEPPARIFYDDDEVLNISNGLGCDYALFLVEREIMLIDQLGQISTSDKFEAVESSIQSPILEAVHA